MSCLRGAPSPAHKEEEEEDEGEWTKEGTDETSRKVWAPSHWPNEAKSLATQEARFRKERAAARLARETRERRQRRREVAEALVAKERTRDDVAANLKQRVREFREVRYQQAEDARALGADQRGFALLQKPRTRWGEVEAPKGHTAGGARPHYDERVDFRTVSSLPAIPVKGIDYTKASIVEMMQLVAVKHQDPAKHTAAMQHLGRLMAGNFNIDHRVDGYNMRTVMMEAAYYRNHAACAALLHRKADPNARGKFGRTALHIAAVNFSSATTKALLEARADPTITDKFKRTALDVARAKFVPENNRLLLIEKQKTEAIVQAELKRLQEASVASDTTATEERQVHREFSRAEGSIATSFSNHLISVTCLCGCPTPAHRRVHSFAASCTTNRCCSRISLVLWWKPGILTSTQSSSWNQKTLSVTNPKVSISCRVTVQTISSSALAFVSEVNDAALRSMDLLF